MRLRLMHILLFFFAHTATAQAQNIDSMLADGAAKMNGGSYAEAQFIYTGILKMFPWQDTSALINRGKAYIAMNKYTEALSDFNSVLARYPQYAGARIKRADAHARLRKFDESLADLDTVLLANPDDSVALNNRGVVKWTIGHYDDAIDDLERAVRLAPTNALYNMNLGRAQCKAGRHIDGIVSLSLAIAYGPGNAYYYAVRGAHLADIDSCVAAIADFDKALSMNKEGGSANAATFYGRAYCKFKMADYAGAIRDFNIVLLYDGNDKWALYFRGRSKIALGNKTEGCEDLNKAKKLGVTEAKQEIKKNCR